MILKSAIVHYLIFFSILITATHFIVVWNFFFLFFFKSIFNNNNIELIFCYYLKNNFYHFSLFSSLPDPTQKLLTLIFGTLSAIAMNSISSKSLMNAHALGVCVAPSFFVSCGDQTKVSLNDIESYRVSQSFILIRCNQMPTNFTSFLN